LYGREMPSKGERRGPDFARLIEFQANSIAGFLRDSRELLRSLNPNLAFYMNSGARGANWATGRLNRIIGPEQDILGSEGGFLAGDLTRIPLWKPSLTARLLETQAPDKPRVVFSAGGQKPWTFSLLPAAELKLLYASTIANAANVWFGLTPMDLDQPEMKALREMNDFLARNTAHYTGTRSAARVAVVWSDTTANFYNGAGAQLMDVDTVRQKSEAGNLEAEFSGLSEALLRDHIPFDVVDDVTLDKDSLQRYDLIFLPNVACMSDRVAARLRDYVEKGGNLFSTFETSLYDETGIHRKTFALGELFDAGTAGEIVGPMRWDFIKPAGSHALLQGLNRTLFPSTVYHLRAKPAAAAPLLFFTRPLAGRYDGVPEVSTDPALIVKRYGAGTSAYFSGDLGSAIASFHIPEHLHLIENAARTFSRPAVSVETLAGSVEVVVRSQGESRRLVHLVNFTGEMTRPIQNVVPLRDVAVSLPGSFRTVRTLVHPGSLPVSPANRGATRVTLPLLNEYEVLVFEK
ncbi:MAG: beta-galactosidase trimerization domain-containing protein, partial [Bryobacteraceae bacterium]